MSVCCDYEHAARMLDCLGRLLVLTDTEREVWVDHRVVGLTLAAIADREGVSPQAIQQRLRRSDRKLNRHLAAT